MSDRPASHRVTDPLSADEVRPAAPPPTFGDPLPPVPEDRRPPELLQAKGTKAALRRAWIRLSRRRPPEPLLPSRDLVKRLVVVHPGTWRDLVFLEPALRTLRRRYAQADRVLYADSAAREFFAGMGWGEVLPLKKLPAEAKHAGVETVLVDFTREVEYERAKALLAMGVAHRAGYGPAQRDRFLTLPQPLPEIDVHDVDAALRVAGALGAPSLGAVPNLPHGLDRKERGFKLWHDEEISAPVVLAPGWEGAPYGWPETVFREVGRRLGKRAVVMTRAMDRDSGESLAATLAVPHLHDRPVRELMDRLATAGLVVGCDGGLVHLAAGLGVPVVVLTINPHPWRTWPRADSGAVVFRGQGPDGKVDFTRVSPAEMVALGLQLMQPVE